MSDPASFGDTGRKHMCRTDRSVMTGSEGYRALERKGPSGPPEQNRQGRSDR
jgi:hypothetical protein